MANREQMKLTLEQMAFPVYEGRERLHSRPSEKTASDTLAVVFLGSDIELEGALKPLRAWKASGRPMIFIFSEAAERLLPTTQLIKRFKPSKTVNSQSYEGLREVIGTIAQVYVPNLTQNTAAKLAVGIQDDLPTTLLWQCLALNKPVSAMTGGIEHAWFNIGSNPAMVKTMQGHLAVLAQYGLQVGLPDFSQGPVQGADGKAKAAASTSGVSGKTTEYIILSDTLSQKVITERHILSLEKGCRLGVKKGVKITPLAREAARKRKIELLQMEERNNL